ncbi:hypothetical protein LZ023_23340 [Pseudomonas silvicola]|nr:hypothetical protein LZ023_23340 [Pseudomonas silvicola]
MTEYHDNIVPLRRGRVFADDGRDPTPLDDDFRQLAQQTFAGTDVDCGALGNRGQYAQALEYVVRQILEGPQPGENLLAFVVKAVHLPGDAVLRLQGCAKALRDLGNGVPGASEQLARARRRLCSNLHPAGPDDLPG